MEFGFNVLRSVACGRGGSGARATRRPRRLTPSCDTLEGRVTPAHFGAHALAAHAFAEHAFAAAHARHGTGTVTGTTTGTTTGSNTTNSTVTADRQALQAAVLAVESHVQTPVSDLAAIRTAFNAIQADTSITTTPSHSALATFENNLVANTANGTTTGTTLADFEALYGSPTGATQVTELTNAYNALVTAVNASGITSTDISNVSSAYTTLQTDLGNASSTSTYPYFNLVTGSALGFGGGPGFGGHGGGC